MNKGKYLLAAGSILAMLFCCYSALQDVNDAGDSIFGESLKTATTTTTTATVKNTTTTTKPTDTAEKRYKSCNSFCKGIDYEGGECRVSGMECRIHLEVKSPYASHMCTGQRLHTCCCQTDDSV